MIFWCSHSPTGYHDRSFYYTELVVDICAICSSILLKCIRICSSVCRSLETSVRSTARPLAPDGVVFCSFWCSGRYENVETVSEQLLHNKLQIVNSNVGFIHDLAMCNKPPGVILFSVISTILIWVVCLSFVILPQLGNFWNN